MDSKLLADIVIAFLQKSAKERGGYSTIINELDDETGLPSVSEDCFMVFDGTFRIEDLRMAFSEQAIARAKGNCDRLKSL